MPDPSPSSAHVCTRITFDVDADKLPYYTDEHLAALWHIAQANPAPFGDRGACDFAERVGREIIRRFLAQTGPELWNHQGRHVNSNSAIREAAAKEANDNAAIDAFLRNAVVPGAIFSTAKLLELLSWNPTPEHENNLRAAMQRCGFVQTKRVKDGVRQRVWVAPGGAPA